MKIKKTIQETIIREIDVEIEQFPFYLKKIKSTDGVMYIHKIMHQPESKIFPFKMISVRKIDENYSSIDRQLLADSELNRIYSASVEVSEDDFYNELSQAIEFFKSY